MCSGCDSSRWQPDDSWQSSVQSLCREHASPEVPRAWGGRQCQNMVGWDRDRAVNGPEDNVDNHVQAGRVAAKMGERVAGSDGVRLSLT